MVTTTFYKKRIEKQETDKKEHEMNYLRSLVMNRLSEIERRQSECTETVNKLRLSIDNSKKFGNLA